MFKRRKNKKAFTLIELIVVMAIIGILVLLSVPKFMGYTKRAQITEIKSNIKQIENASERYYMDKGNWPKFSDVPYTAEQLENFAQEIKDKTGSIVTLEKNGKYYEIDYNKLKKYIQKPKDNIHYIIQNPVGEIYYLDNLTKEGKATLYRNNQKSEEPEESEELEDVKTNNKPTAVITMTPNTNITTLTTITWSYEDSTDPDGDTIANVEWQGKQDIYTIEGNYTVQLRVQDSNGLWSDWASKTFYVVERYLNTGTNGHVEIDNQAFFNPDYVTLEAWVRIPDNDGEKDILNKQESGSYTINAQGKWNTEIYINGAYRIIFSDEPAEVNKWVHVASTYDGNIIKLYINGKLQQQTYNIVGKIRPTTVPLEIGANSPHQESFLNSDVKNVMIWNYARSQEEIQSDMHNELTGSENGLLGYWKLNEGTGNIAYDSSINKNNGTIYGNYIWK